MKDLRKWIYFFFIVELIFPNVDENILKVNE